MNGEGNTGTVQSTIGTVGNDTGSMETGVMNNPLFDDIGGGDNSTDSTINQPQEMDNGNPLLTPESLIDGVRTGEEFNDLNDVLGIRPSEFGGVDLQAFGDILDFDSPESREYISQQISELKGNGFNNDQIQYFVDQQISTYQDAYEEAMEDIMNEYDVEEELSPAEVQAVLEQELTTEEKRNLKPLAQWVRSTVNDSDLLNNDVMMNIFTDPLAIKLLNTIYKKSMMTGASRVTENVRPQIQQSRIQVSPTQAIGFYKEWLAKEQSYTPEKRDAQIAKLRGLVNHDALRDFDELFSVFKS